MILQPIIIIGIDIGLPVSQVWARDALIASIIGHGMCAECARTHERAGVAGTVLDCAQHHSTVAGVNAADLLIKHISQNGTAQRKTQYTVLPNVLAFIKICVRR